MGRISRRILGVGIATLDLVNEVAEYPPEDAEVRALGQRVTRGGNCANTLAVLAQLGHACAWVGTIADDAGGARILADLAARGVSTEHAVRVPDAVTPTSYISLSRHTGSRTIVHFRRLRELEAVDLAAVPLSGFDWVHLEGRAPGETAAIIRRIRQEAPGLPISLELEKPRPGIEALFDGPDVLMVSRAFALDRAGAHVGPARFPCRSRRAVQRETAGPGLGCGGCLAARAGRGGAARPRRTAGPGGRHPGGRGCPERRGDRWPGPRARARDGRSRRRPPGRHQMRAGGSRRPG